MAKYFVAFNFSSDGLLSRKVTGFRKRFDPKYNQYSFPHMAMLAPFEVQHGLEEDLIETLKEEVETFYFGQDSSPSLAFTGLGVFEHKKKKILYLNPHYCTDLEYLSEMVLEICTSFIPKSLRYKPNQKQFLPLGVFLGNNELEMVLDAAKEEFSSNSELPIESISLYENKMGIWYEKEILINFEDTEKQFLQLNHQTL